jgi:prepilin-type N-terminal cleavage/methylation domain-containing protein
MKIAVMINFFSKESAFSLIEVLIALLLLSMVSTGVGKLLLENRRSSQQAIIYQEIAIISVALIEAIRNDPMGFQQGDALRYWQQKLEEISPQAEWVIVPTGEEKCSYRIKIIFSTAVMTPIEFNVDF